MTILENITQIAASSSDLVWAVDTDTNTVYRRNIVTKDFEKVPVNIAVASLDVSADGHVVALDTAGKLYVWNPATTLFELRAEDQTFDQVSIGDAALWVREAATGTLLLWDDDSGGFAEVGYPGSAASAFVAAKAEDAFYVVDNTTGTLWQYTYPIPASPGEPQEPGTWQVVTDDLGANSIESLVASREEDLWALDGDGDLYQLNTVDLDDLGAPPTFVPQSDSLGIGPLSDFTIDESGVLYGTSGDDVSFVQTETEAVQTRYSDSTSAVALGTDGAGRTHYAFSTDGGVFHSFLRDGEWINAQFIPGSGLASEISIDFDGNDNVYISWVESVGNGSEVFVAEGVKNEGFDGYRFGPGHQVTDDEVSDRDLDMHVTPDGQVTLSVTKHDALSKYDDKDIYHYSLDGNGPLFQRAPDIDAVGFNDDGKFLELEPLQQFLTGEDGLGGGGVSAVFPFTFGFKYKAEGDPFSMRLFVRGISDSRGDETEYWAGYEFVAGLNIAAIFPVSFEPIKDFKLSVLSDGRVNPGPPFESLISAGWRLNLDADFWGSKGLGAPWPGFDLGAGDKFADIGLGVFGELDFLWVIEELSTPTLDAGEASAFAIPIDFVDENGQPITDDTPPSDVRARFAPDQLALFGLTSTLPNLFGADGSDPGGGDFEFLEIFGQHQSWFIGLYLEAKLGGNLEFKTRNGLQAGTEGTLGNEIRTEIGFRSFGEFFWNPFYARLWDLRVGGKIDQEAFAAAPVFGEFNTGGFTDLYDDGLVIAADGTPDGESDILDNSEFDYVVLPDNSVVGVYVQAEIDQADRSLNTINTIDGTYTPSTGEIVWDLDSIKEVPGSKGISSDPRIALGGDAADPKLIVTWANVSTENEELGELIDTPPGKAYVIFGGDVENKTVELAGLRNGPAPILNRDFFYTTAEGTSLLGVGTSAAQLGDVNTGSGKTDFIIGAPEAVQESGKAYVVFGEGFRNVPNLDDGSDGTHAFNVLGDLDSELGFAVGTAGDYNKDGIADIAISAPGADNHDGAVYVIYGGQDFTKVGGQGAPGQFTVDDIATVLDGVKLTGPTDGGRWGTALAGGYDFTGAGGDDLAVGSVEDGTITLVNRDDVAGPITIELVGDFAQDTNPNDYGLGDIGGSLAMLEDINGDGSADLLIGDTDGSAYVVFGGDDFRNYARNYVVSWGVEDDVGPDYQVLLSFRGEDRNGDGILSSTIPGEIFRLRMEVFEDDTLQYVANTGDIGAFDLNYELATGLVLVDSAAASDPENGIYGLSIRPGDVPRFELFSVGADPSIRLEEVTNLGRTPVAESPGGNTLFAALSTPDSFDLQYLADFPRSGFTLASDTPLPVQVAAAGDVDGDDQQDFIVGFDQADDEDGNPLPGDSYVVFGGEALTALSGIVDLDDLVQQGQAYDIGRAGAPGGVQAGGAVSSAGDVNGDGIGDLLVSAPNDGSGAELSGKSWVIYGSQDIRDENFVAEIGFVLENTNALERSGAALTSLGDLNGDGFDDLLVGAPQAPDTDLAFEANEDAEILYSLRDPDNPTPVWTRGKPVVDGPDNGGSTPPEDPLALAQTELGMLAAWISQRTDADGDTFSTLFTSFFDGNDWSTPEAVGPETANFISEATIAEVRFTRTEIQPLIVWVESDPEQSETTTVFQSRYKDGWQEPSPVAPIAADVPSPAGFNFVSENVLVVGDESLSVADVHMDEPETGSTFASFVVTRKGDTSQASGPYEFRLKDYSATFGLDFAGDHTGTFSFEAGETTKDITVEILADSLIESTEQLRLEISSTDASAFVSDNGLAVPGAKAIAATLTVEDSNTVLNLNSIDSGFKLNGDSDVALGYAVSAAGKFNADEIGDFMIGAPTAGLDNEGKAYLIYGKGGISIELQEFELDDLDAEQGAILVGGDPDVQAGSSLASGRSGLQPFVAVGAPGDADTAGRVYVVVPRNVAGSGTKPNEIILDDDTALVLSIDGTETDVGDAFGRAVTVANLNEKTDSGNLDDLIVTSGEAIYVIYDVLSQGLTGDIIVDPDNSPFEVTKIVNGEGTGFGDGLAVLDLDGDKYNDLVVGSAAGNPLVNQYGLEQGVGGSAAVIWGSDTGLDTDEDIDVNNLGDQGFRLLGQAAFAPTEGNLDGDPNSPGGSVDNNGPLAGTPLVDGIGDAIAAVDLDGDGLQDLIIGAPLASIADPDGQQSFKGANAGRVYVLFAGDSDWRTDNVDYQLLDLYGSRFQDGLVLEGTEAGGFAGTSLANVGFFRGVTDQETEIEDLGIGAPAANGAAGQAYIVFGSQINYSNIIKAGDNVFKIAPVAESRDIKALPVFTYQGPAELLNESNLPVQAAVGFDVAGLGDIDAAEFDLTGGTEFAIGAPFSDVDGNSQTYIATGHSWIVPGQSLDVEDLRADNGFIIPQRSGTTVPVGDFNGDGYDDYLLAEVTQQTTNGSLSSLTLVLGASTFDIEASTNREIVLDTAEGAWGRYFTAGDFDGDGRAEIVALIDTGEPEQRFQTVVYTADALADPDTAALSPVQVTAPDSLADFIALPISVLGFHSPDLNGDGFDDLFVSGLNEGSGSALNSFALGTPTLGVFGDQFQRLGDEDLAGVPLAFADFNGDGTDEVVLANNLENPAAGDARILSWNDATQSLEVVVANFDWAALGGTSRADNPFAFDRQNIYQASSAGDVNGDGYEDVVISFRGAREVTPQIKPSSILVYGAEEFEDITGAALRPFVGTSEGAISDPIIPRQFADIVRDTNGDGFDDILVSQVKPEDFAFVIYGGEDLPQSIALPDPGFDLEVEGFEIQGFSQREGGLPYLVSAAGDVNGDGLGDFILSDDTIFDLTFTVYGERDETEAQGAAAANQANGASGVEAMQTEILDGTRQNDYIVQSQDAGIVSILAKEGDDVVLTRANTKVLAYLGEGDDRIGIGDVDGSAFLRIDGGNGFDTLFFNEALGEPKTLDLTSADLKGKVTGFEMVDLGVQNGLTLDVVSLKELTGSGNTLLVRGEDAKLNLKREPDGSWEKVGTNAHDGVVYDVYQFAFDDQFQFDDGPTSNFSVWVEQGGVSFNDLQAGTDGRDKLRGTREDDNIFGDGGRDFIFGRRGDDTLDGGEGRDFLMGGSGDDELRGGPDGDTLKGGPGADTYIGSAEDFFGDRIIGFGKHDQIIVEGFDFNDVSVERSCFGQTEILFDIDADGEFDGSLLVKRLFGRPSFQIEQVDGDTVITLESQDRFGGYLSSIFERLFDGWDYA